MAFRDFQGTKEGYKKLGAMVPDELYRAAQVQATRENTTVGGLVERALRYYLGAKAYEAERKP